MMNIQKAVEFFLDNRDLIPVFIMPKGDFAAPVHNKRDLFLVVEKEGRGIFVARLAPDLMNLRELHEEAAEEARQFIYRRLQEANLADRH
ncbi:MAG: hypothetical protein IMW93_08100 [Thermoanaerobacteraceae bacterium]|nr:hypothetical protein [Thermoanaerobacteraceae bacterium]